MARPDILLGDNKVSVIRQTVVSTDERGDPDITLTPNSASLRLGGGGGQYSEGDLRLADREDNVRIHASTGGGAFDRATTRMLIDGTDASISLGAENVESGNADIELTPDSASIRLGGGEGTYSEGDLRLTDREDNVRIHASAGEGAFDLKTTRILFRGDSGTLQLGAKALENETGDDIADVTIRPKWATLTLGGGGGSNSDGDIRLRDRDGDTRIHLTGGRGDTFSTTRIEIDGKDGNVTVSTEDGTTRGQLGCSETAAASSVRYFGAVTKGTLRVGGAGIDGTFELDGPTDDKRIRIGGYRTGDDLDATRDDPTTRVRITMRGELDLGGDGDAGSISVSDGQDTETVAVDGAAAEVTLGGAGQNEQNGRLFVGGDWDRSGVEIDGDYLGVGIKTDEFRSHRRIELDGNSSSIDVYDSGGNERISVTAATSTIMLLALSQSGGTYQSLTIDGSAGTITLSDGSHDTIVIDGQSGDIQVGSGQSLVNTIQTLQNDVSDLESRVAALESSIS